MTDFNDLTTPEGREAARRSGEEFRLAFTDPDFRRQFLDMLNKEMRHRFVDKFDWREEGF